MQASLRPFILGILRVCQLETGDSAPALTHAAGMQMPLVAAQRDTVEVEAILSNAAIMAVTVAMLLSKHSI